jgi:hypothetical protein
MNRFVLAYFHAEISTKTLPVTLTVKQFGGSSALLSGAIGCN